MFRRYTVAIGIIAWVAIASGCGDTRPPATGVFVGPVSAVRVQTRDREWCTIYTMHVQQGPPFVDERTKMTDGSNFRWPSAGKDAVLVKDRRGNAYLSDVNLAGGGVRISGVMRMSGRTLINGEELSRTPGAHALPFWALEVRGFERGDEEK